LKLSNKLSSLSWICVGKIKKAHSLKGELFLFLFSKTSDWYEPSIKVGLSEYPTKQPHLFYSIHSLSPHKDGFILSLEGVKDRNHSESLSKLFLCIPEDYLVSTSGELPYLHEFLNFQVLNQGIFVGLVESFSSNGAQDLLCVRAQDSKTLYEIPFVEAFIQEIHYTEKILHLHLPEGLLELNLSHDSKTH
jgi:16S rRNA processing protein RimM